MAPCQRCGKEEAEWRCQVCGRVVDTACARPTADGVFCIDHAPKAKHAEEAEKGAAKPEKKGSKSLEQLFVMLFALTLGLVGIVYVGDYLLSTVLGGIADTTGFSAALKGSGWMIVYGMGGLTFLIGMAWLASRRRAK